MHNFERQQKKINSYRYNMKISNLKTALATAVIGAAGLLTANAGDYNVKVNLPAEANGSILYLANFDTGDKIDSVKVADGVANFKFTAERPFVASLMLGNQRAGRFIAEEGNIEYTPARNETKGGRYDAIMTEIQNKGNEIAQRYQAATSDTLKEQIFQEYIDSIKKAAETNIDNPVGYLLFLDVQNYMAPDEVDTFIKNHPSLEKYTRVQKIAAINKVKASTQPGNKFADFEIEYDGVKHRLSDVVGKGDYVLVDFWASWCGPCIRQTKVIKEIYSEYKDKGLKVLGVAVWDDPEDTKDAIKKHDLPWDCWLNGQNIPTDAYGISGIPCIILYGPDGTILSRDKQDDELKADVRAAFEKAN